ncbi:protein-methionine sulfoxide oxidase mical3b [Alosa pseudoharengus]|uniref:protein-methionine sulfoxide oxidase mical3b n=1 Tax=Alosa pseudoharengus TaxID=34774 RepID=UPI003F88A203
MDEQAQVLFDAFVQASTCRATLSAFEQVCLLLRLQPGPRLYHTLRPRLDYWRVRGLWARLDKRAAHTLYQNGYACANTTCLIIGAGPCGLRTAVELALLGARVLLLEKRDSFSRNNVLHLWPCTIHDLRGLGAKKFYGQFCAGSIDHISIRQLQLILLKVALLLGVEVHVNVEFKDLKEPSDDQQTRWRAVVNPKNHPISQIDIDVVIGADGRRNTLPGFRRKEFRGKLAIAITANFINRRTRAEAQAQEISGVAFIFNQSFFQELRAHTGIDLENIVYYKDDTHYFVMTAKKQSLLKKGVILRDYADTEQLLSRANVDQNALLSYAREAADFSTNHQLPVLDFAINHYGQPDVAMFDFTCMYASESAALVRQRGTHTLLLTLVGDSLLEPFWPMGTGIARGFMAAMDTAWMIRSWAQGSTPLEVLAERESVYRLLPQTTPENISKNYGLYSLDPLTRYPNVNKRLINPAQVFHLLDTGEGGFAFPERLYSTPQMTRQESVRSNALLNWCQEQTRGYRGVHVCDLTSSWRSGLALCALIHHNRPDLIDFDSLDPRDAVSNGQLGLDVAEHEFGISPIMTGTEMSLLNEADPLSMVLYLSQLQQLLKEAAPSAGEQDALIRGTLISSISLLNKLGHSFSRKRNPNPKDKKEREEDRGKRRRRSQAGQSEEEDMPSDHHGNQSSDVAGVMDESLWLSAGGNHNRVRSMATLLLAKFEENAPSPSPLTSARRQPPGGVCASDVCFFCGRRVYALERLSAEAKFFHRSCFQCNLCSTTLRLASYTYDELQGKFYCKQHYETLTGIHRRKSTAATFYSMSTQLEYCTPPPAPHALALTHTLGPAHTLGSAHVTPERIELENYTPSHSHTLSPASPLLEVPEETLTQHNLSQRELSGEEPSSSESDLEELEDLQAREERGKQGDRQTDEGRGGEEEQRSGGGEEAAESGEEEGEDYADSSDEGEYSPWERERWSGVWLGPVTEEEEAGLVKESSDVEDYPDHYGSLDTPDVSVMSDARFSLSSSSTLLCSAVTPTQPSSPTLTQSSTPQRSTHTPPNTPPETLEKRSVRRSEVIQEFWTKSSEIRKRLGATPRAHTHAPTRSRHTHTHSHTSSTDGSTPATQERVGERKCVCEECVCAEVAQRLSVIEQNLLTPPCSPATHANSTHANSTHANSNSNSNANSDPNLFDSSQPKLDTEFDPSLIPDLSADPNVDLNIDPELDPMPCCKVDFAPGSRSPPLVCEVLLSSSGPVQIAAHAHTHTSADPDTQLASDAQLESAKRVGQRVANELSPPDPPEMKEMSTQTSSASGRPKLAENGTSSRHAHPDTTMHAGRNTTMHAGRTVEPRVVVEAEQRRRLGIFSPRKTPRSAHTLPPLDRPKHKSLWRSVFSGYRRKKKEAEPGGAVGGASQEAGKRSRSTDLRFKKNQTFSADSSLSCSDVLERLPLRAQLSFEPSDIQKDIIKEEEEGEDEQNGDERRSARPRRPAGPQTPPDSSCSTEVVGVWVVPPDPSSLSVSTDILQELQQQRQPLSDTPSLADSSDPKHTRRIQKEAQRHAKQQELKRLHRAQMIQRQLEQVEVKQRQLEEMGVAVEKALRGEADYWEDSNSTAVLDMHLGAMGAQDDPSLMQQWFKLVQEKNALVRYESELMIFARELELEDRQSRLQQELRERMAVDDHLKGEEELAEERSILCEMLEVVEQRDWLVSLLEEQRLKEREEDRDLEATILSKGFSLHWT